MQDKTRFINRILIAGVLIYAWMTLVFGHGELLYAIQDFNPFLGTSTFFRETISHPGGLREWTGGWLTQLFYYRIFSLKIYFWALTDIYGHFR